MIQSTSAPPNKPLHPSLELSERHAKTFGYELFDTDDKMCLVAINIWLEMYLNEQLTSRDRHMLMASVSMLTKLGQQEIEILYNQNF